MSQIKSISNELLAAALRAPAGCPPEERFAKAASGELAEAELADLMEHAKSCPTCAAELDLARAFAEDIPEAGSRARADVDAVVERLRSPVAPTNERELAPVVPIGPSRSRRRAGSHWQRWAALAATLAAIAVGVSLQQARSGPVVPSLAGPDVVRGGELRLSTPLGELPTVPGRVEWTPIDGAVRYELEILGVDDAVVLATSTDATGIELSDEQRGRIESYVRYRVRVVAYDEGGALVARSEPVELFVAPVPK